MSPHKNPMPMLYQLKTAKKGILFQREKTSEQFQGENGIAGTKSLN